MMDDLTAFQRDVLYVVASMNDDPYPHGLSIKNELDQHYSGEINHGRLYPSLDELVEKGLIEKDALDKRTNSYTLTQRGRREIEARRDWENQYLDTDAEA
jgi:PadR family transcriptional regulator PadR